MPIRPANRGFLILELFIAISIFLIVGVLIILSGSYLFQRQQNTISQSQASRLAQEAIEIVYSLSLNNWNIIDNNDNNTVLHPVVETSTGLWNLQSGPETVNGYTRALTIRQVQRDATGQIITSGTGTPDLNTRIATITITWIPPGTNNLQTHTTTHYLLRPSAVVQAVPSGGGSTATCRARVDDDLVAHYTFVEGAGTTIQDRSGFGTPLNLTIDDINKVAWLPTTKGLKIVDPTVTISSNVGTGNNKASSEPKTRNEITVEAWYRPYFPIQSGENGGGRIIVLSDRTVGHSINYILGQELSSIIGRLRMRMTSSSPDFDAEATWYPLFSTAGNLFNENQLAHLVFTREPNPQGGEARVYLNGQLMGTRYIPGDFYRWVNTFDLGIGNDLLEPWPAVGEYYMAAIYRRALDNWEVQTNYQAGPQNDCQTPTLQQLTYADSCAGITNNFPNTNWPSWSKTSIGSGITPGIVRTVSATSINICGSGQSGEYKVTADQGEYVYQTSNQARMELTARLDVWVPPGHNLSSFGNPYSYVGLAVRSSPIADNSPMLMYTTNGMNVLTLAYRNTAGQIRNHFFGTNATSQVVPIWLKIVKYNNYIGRWYSTVSSPVFPDDWVYHNPREITGLSSTYTFGFIVGSEFNGRFARARFTDVDVKFGTAAFNLCGSGMCVPAGGGGGGAAEPPPGSPPPQGGGSGG